MDPNTPQEQPNVTPEPEQMPPTPDMAPTPAPATTPTPEPTPSPVFSAPPAPMGSTEAPMKKPFPVKLVAIIAGAVIALGGIIALVLALTGGTGGNPLFGGASLTKYEDTDYSISVPTDFQKKASLYTDDYFADKDYYDEEDKERLRATEPDTWEGGKYADSQVSVSRTEPFSATTFEKLEGQIQKQADAMKEGDSAYSKTYKNVEFSKTKIDSFDAIMLKADVYNKDGDELEGKVVAYYIYISDKEYYVVSVGAQAEDTDIMNAMDTIAKSFDKK